MLKEAQVGFIERIRRPERPHEAARERMQSIMRVVITLCVLIYLVAQRSVSLDAAPSWFVYLIGYLAVSAAELAIAFRLRASRIRRTLFAMADIVTVSYLMVTTGAAGIPLFALYCWIALGNGFGFGLAAMFFSAVLSLIGFAAVVGLSDAWKDLTVISIAVGTTLAALPIYAAFLIHQWASAAKRAEEASAAKSHFLARISHELRTPLNGILGTTELLRTNKRLTREDRSLLDVIRECVNISLRQIENVLDFSKIESGKLVIEHVEFDLHDLLNRSVRLVHGVAVEKNLRLLLRVDPTIPYRLVGDPHHLHEVLLNLLSNAVKFTDVGYVSLEARLIHQDPRSAAVRFEVHDTGIGIAPHAQERIFEPFSQEDTSTKRHFGGTGLGTTISKQLVELMGGELRLESTKGKGTTFYATISFGRQSADATVLELPGMRAMLVSDNAVLRERTETATLGWGVSLTLARSLSEATALLARGVRLNNPVHVVLVDDSLALSSSGLHRADDFLDKASLLAPAFLISDRSPREAELRSWGYAALLSRKLSREVLFNALHTSGLYAPDTDRGVVRVEPWAWGRISRRRARLLIADDNRTNLMILRKILETANYDVDVAENGDQALQMMLNGAYRAAIVDMHMPGLDGIAVVKQYRMLQHGARMPIVMLTANATIDAKLATAESGADAYLTKPAPAGTVVSTIQRLLDETEVYDLALRRSAQPTDEIKVLNTEVITELDRLYNDAAAVAQIFNEFESESARLLQQIAEAVGKKNHALFCDLLHALKGNGANVGAVRLVRVCDDIESRGLFEFRREGEQMLRRLQTELRDIVEALRDLNTGRLPGSDSAHRSDLS